MSRWKIGWNVRYQKMTTLNRRNYRSWILESKPGCQYRKISYDTESYIRSDRLRNDSCENRMKYCKKWKMVCWSRDRVNQWKKSECLSRVEILANKINPSISEGILLTGNFYKAIERLDIHIEENPRTHSITNINRFDKYHTSFDSSWTSSSHSLYEELDILSEF